MYVLYLQTCCLWDEILDEITQSLEMILCVGVYAKGVYNGSLEDGGGGQEEREQQPLVGEILKQGSMHPATTTTAAVRSATTGSPMD